MTFEQFRDQLVVIHRDYRQEDSERCGCEHKAKRTGLPQN
jgi:hypothetical protein